MDPEWPVTLLSSCAPQANSRYPLGGPCALKAKIELALRVPVDFSHGTWEFGLGLIQAQYYNHVETPQEKQSSWPQGDPRMKV